MKAVNLHLGNDAWIRSIKERVQRAFADACGRHVIVQAPLGQLPWYHHLTLSEHLKSRGDRIVYAAQAVG